MFPKVCPVCKSKISEVDCKRLNDSIVHSSCRSNQKFKKARVERPRRTSTPISDVENREASGFSDSVSDFFYQSWKNGLHSDESTRSQIYFNDGFNQANLVPQTFCYAPQIIYVNQFICSPFGPYLNGHMQQIGYRPDGTYGLIPPYWS